MALAGSAAAFPRYFYNPAAYEEDWGRPRAAVACDEHPHEDLESIGAPHGTPWVDSDIIFTLTVDGKPTASVCPGAQHSIKVSFATFKRLALLTANLSDVTFTLPAATPGCPNRVDLGGSLTTGEKTSHTAKFTAPCSAAGKTVMFFLTSAANGDGINWKQNNLTLQVAPLDGGDEGGGGGRRLLGADPCAKAVAACLAPPTPDGENDASGTGGDGEVAGLAEPIRKPPRGPPRPRRPKKNRKSF
ncbi:hypothetical protein HYH03_000877 [Edaphochlamys debaryana]|uniref:Uncharacterized protein n=1 Tax=Edaphochlamys debaryana TaxID=47281 RepID=A0A836C6E8_9CHLO|nr:hypothetical protein HYH03_000877 [Edaphochlamys debaryana]|eukprot:KAG2501058.1 hypothetical protein HYH03_000877 [Edaphochlamys debaryana]